MFEKIQGAKKKGLTTRYLHNKTMLTTKEIMPKCISLMGDELALIQDLRKVPPFSVHPERTHDSFQQIQRSLLNSFDRDYIYNWIKDKKIHFALDSGNYFTFVQKLAE